MAERSRESVRRGTVPRRGRTTAGARAARTRQPPRRAPLVLAFPSRLALLPMVQDVVRHAALGAGFDAPVAADLAAAAVAAASNVIEHAYSGSDDARVEVWMDDRGDQFRIELRDSGKTMDPRAPDTGRTGRGTRLMERVMDSVTYRRSARRNVCCLVRRLQLGPA